MSKAIDGRLARLEAARAAALLRDPVKDWLALYRAGASIEVRNAAGGAPWVNAAIERHRLADETMVDYGDD